MIWYLLPIFSLGKQYLNPDSTSQFSLNSTTTLLQFHQNSIFCVALDQSSTLLLLTPDFQILSSNHLSAETNLNPLKLIVASQINIVFNMKYEVNNQLLIPEGEKPAIGSINGLILQLDLNGQLIRSLWVDYCYDGSEIIDFEYFDRFYFITKSKCRNDQICIVGVQGEKNLCFNENFKKILVRKNENNEVFIILNNKTLSQVILSQGLVKVFEVNQEIIEVYMKVSVFVLFKEKISLFDTNWNENKYFNLPSFNNYSLKSDGEYLYLAITTSSSFLSYKSQTLSTILLCFDLNLSLKFYRVYSNTSLSLLSVTNSMFLFFDDRKIIKAFSPFDVREIENCEDLKVNLLGSATCLACRDELILIGNECFKNFTCPAGTVKDLVSFTCLRCYEGCSSCSGLRINQCLACENGYILFENTCRTVCPSGFYQSGLSCFPCQDGCSVCNSTSCLFCQNLLLYNGSCIEKCPEDLIPINGECKNCEILNCESCYYGECRSCRKNYFLDSNICKSCPQGCTSCLSSTICESCESTFLLVNSSCIPDNCLTYHNSTCQSCTPGSYLSNSRCLPCPANCEKCQNQTCEKCLPSYSLSNSTCQACGASSCNPCEPLLQFQNTCIATCPINFYESNSTCIPCPDNCETCTSSSCSSCKIDYSRHQTYHLQNGTCQIQSCLSGYSIKSGSCQKSYSSLQLYLKNLINLFY